LIDAQLATISAIVKLPNLPLEYSATLVRSDGYVIRNFQRSDRRRGEGEFAGAICDIVIARGDLGVLWSWQPGNRWREQTIDWRTISSAGDPSDDLFWKEIGPAEIDGDRCSQYRGFADESCNAMREERFILPCGIRRRVTTYRLDGSVGIVIDCRDISLKPPALTLFELPAGADVQRLRPRSKRASEKMDGI
jgi:hypothetical protein